MATSTLRLQKRLASSVLRCGKKKVWLDPNETNEIANANSREFLGSAFLLYPPHFSSFVQCKVTTIMLTVTAYSPGRGVGGLIKWRGHENMDCQRFSSWPLPEWQDGNWGQPLSVNINKLSLEWMFCFIAMWEIFGETVQGLGGGGKACRDGQGNEVIDWEVQIWIYSGQVGIYSQGAWWRG